MMRRFALIALALLAACGGEKAVEPKNADDFGFNAAVEPQGSGAVQRIEVPAAALVALKREDMGDIRVFDGRGKALSIARFGASAQGAAMSHKVPTYPIAGTAAAPGGPAVSIEIAQPGQTVSVEANGASPGNDTAAALVDTRALEDPAVAVVLDADLPAQTPVSFTLEASSDLKSWDTLGDRVLFSPGTGQAPLGGARIALPGVDLEKRYLRLSWKAAQGVAVRDITVLTAKTAPPRRTTLAAAGAKLDDPHNLRFSLPSPAPLAAILVTGTEADGMVPVKLYGREAVERPWVLLSVATVRPGGKAAMLDFDGVRYAQYRIEADERSAGFSEAPKIAVEVEPLTLLAAFNGQPPYRLATGNAKAESKLFAPSELAEPKVLEGTLPLAKVEAAPPPVIALNAGATDSPFAPRKLALWGALLLGTALLAYGAIRLLKANAAPSEGEAAG
jgi:Protein of unknown function (DUF3999)